MLIDIYNVLSLCVLPIPNSAFPKISINLLPAILNETALSKVVRFAICYLNRNFISFTNGSAIEKLVNTFFLFLEI